MRTSNQIKKFILDNLKIHKKDIIQTSINHFGISRQAMHKHMKSLIEDKKVVAFGNTKGRYYKLNPSVNYTKNFELTNEISTEIILKENILPNIKSLKDNIFEIFEFSIGALLNNVVDHANANKIYFKLYINHRDSHFVISDDGIGIFNKIRTGLGLVNTHMAGLELAKGNITTDPDNHSGDELNAIIHLFDKVTIDSSGHSLRFFNDNNEWLMQNSKQQHGTRIHLQIDTQSKRSCAKIFEFIFKKKHRHISIPLNLLELSDYKIINCRSQVKNVLRNIKDYKIIEFDFQKIDLIGPSFADALVRKTKEYNQFANIEWINSNSTVDLLMSRALDRQS